jgi:D-beta-D-heptose 7-phosphate kinase/D-beta-D-heptose 1-phosphate adenosyltransferase
MSTMALAMSGGLSLEDSAALANIAGSVVVGKIGTATVTREDLAHELSRSIARQRG